MIPRKDNNEQSLESNEDYYKSLLIELIENLTEKQRRNLYYIGLGMTKE